MCHRFGPLGNVIPYFPLPISFSNSYKVCEATSLARTTRVQSSVLFLCSLGPLLIADFTRGTTMAATYKCNPYESTRYEESSHMLTDRAHGGP